VAPGSFLPKIESGAALLALLGAGSPGLKLGTKQITLVLMERSCGLLSSLVLSAVCNCNSAWKEKRAGSQKAPKRARSQKASKRAKIRV